MSQLRAVVCCFSCLHKSCLKMLTTSDERQFLTLHLLIFYYQKMLKTNKKKTDLCVHCHRAHIIENKTTSITRSLEDKAFLAFVKEHKQNAEKQRIEFKKTPIRFEDWRSKRIVL